MPDDFQITINGRALDVAPGTLIIEAAKMIGVEIPTFCYDDRLKPVGACRMCLVDVEKMPKLIASCATPVAPNMVIHTDSEKVIKARKGVLEFLLINHPLDCPTCDKGGECPLQDNTFLYGPTTTRYKENKIRFRDEKTGKKFDEIPLGPEVMLCRNRCIMCFKCVRIVRDLAGEADLGVFQRGSSANIGVLEEVKFANEFSGNTVEYCPVGALTSSSFRYEIRDWLLKKTPSVCNLCSDGCNMNVEWSDGKVYRHMSRRNPAVDDGWLCDRGRYGFDLSRSVDKLTQPRIRRGNALEPCGWDEADALVAKHLVEIIDENKASEVAVIGSTYLANEEAFSIRRFFGDIIKTPNIDFQTDTSSPLEPELIDMIGLDGTINDLESDSLFLFVGIDPAVEHPVMSLRIRKAITRRRAKAVFIGSYDKRLGYFPVENIRIPSTAEPSAVNYIISVLKGVESKPAGANLDFERLNNLADVLKSAGNIHIMAGDDFLSHPDRKAMLSSLVNLKKTINAKLSLLSSRGNFMGVSRFGLYGNPDHSFKRILEKVNSGEIKTMFVFGANPVDEFPDRKYVHDTLKKLEFLVVINPFLTPTASLGSIVYPQPLNGEYGGSFVNIEGRVQKFDPMNDNFRLSKRPAWSVISEISSLMDIGERSSHEAQIRNLMTSSLKGMGGLNNIPDIGAMIFTKSDYDPGEIQPKPFTAPPSDKPFLLQWTHSAHHSGWLTEKSSNLMRISKDQVAYLHPDDALSLEISNGNHVRIGTEGTAVNLPIEVSDKVNKGEILIENSFSENPVNRLLNKDNPITFVSVRKN
ncbi:MAG: NADH-quinone oxidoreductase subunit NuoG [candidate division Zixibacteria bacterium]